MSFRTGDRVRITNPSSEYTGCRGTIADGPESAAGNVTQLGHEVAIDGENGRTRPFLISDLAPMRALRVGDRSAARAEQKEPRSEEGRLGD